MSLQTIEADFRRKVGERIRLAGEGVNRYRVFTPFLFEDGDHLAVVLKREANDWVLSDKGHTYMHLTYDLEEKDLQRGSRQKIISNALSVFSVQDCDGELRLVIPQEQYGDALFSFVQALLKITDVSYLSRERVRSTFMEDFRAFMEATVPENRRAFDWHDPQHDPEGKYLVDCRINGLPKPLMVFALPGDDKVRDATSPCFNSNVGTCPTARWAFLRTRRKPTAKSSLASATCARNSFRVLALTKTASPLSSKRPCTNEFHAA